MNKTAMKFLGAAAVLALLGAGALRGIEYYQYRNSPEYALMRHYQKLQEAYQADTYGGDTPEETLRLFIDALKKGDIDLASKYFVVDEWEKKQAELLTGKNNGTIEKFVNFLSSVLKNGQGSFKDSDTYILETVNNKNESEFSFTLVKNQSTHKWKILEL